jgi:hypothetical protein
VPDPVCLVSNKRFKKSCKLLSCILHSSPDMRERFILENKFKGNETHVKLY